MGSNWYTLMKEALYAHDSVRDDERDQLLPSWTPYGTKRKSPNEISETKNKQFDQGHGLGDTRDFIEQYNEMHHESLLDQYDEGSLQTSPQLNGEPLDTIADEPLSEGDTDDQLSPLGEHEITMRKVRTPWLDTKPNRLPGGGNFSAPKPLPRLRRSSLVSPLEEAWAFQMKKGRVQ